MINKINRISFVFLKTIFELYLSSYLLSIENLTFVIYIIIGYYILQFI